MTFDFSEAKQRAFRFYAENKGATISMTLIFSGIALCVEFLNDWILKLINNVVALSGAEAVTFKYFGEVHSFYPAASVAGFIVGFITNIFVAVVAMGMYNWYRESMRLGYTADIGGVFLGYNENFKKNFLMQLLKALYIFLWSLLLYIPGIIKSYAYMMADFVMMEYPDVSPKRALEISEIMTKGHKVDLFIMDLSFIGWLILGGFTFGILYIVLVFPYMYGAQASAYEILKSIAKEKDLVPEFYTDGE